MSRRTVAAVSGLFVLLQLALSSVGVWADARQELAVFTSEVHVEGQAESCVTPHDHRVCVLGRSADGAPIAQAVLPTEPYVSQGLEHSPAEERLVAAVRSYQAPPRGPPSLT